MAKSSALEILYGLGYEPVDIESDADYIRALKESYNKLQIENPSDPRLIELVDAVKGFRQAKSKKEAAKSGGKSRPAKRRKGESFSDVKAKIDAKEKKKKDAMNFISPGSALAPVDPAGDDGGGDMSGALMKISNDVNIIKGIVAAENKIEEDKADDTKEVREKKKRGMREKLIEGGKEGFKKVTGAVGKLLKPVEGVFSQIFKFLSLFLLGSGLMKILDWMGNPDNKSKLDSIFRFLKDYWPAIITALMAFVPGFPVLAGVIALAVGFLPKLINLIKSIFGLGAQVDKEIKKGEKDLTTLDDNAEVKDTTELREEKVTDDQSATVKPPAGAGETPNSSPTNFNQGGAVPGSGDTDTVPAMLTPGEFVLTKDAVKQYGVDTLYGMNAAAGGVNKSNDVPRGSNGKPMKKKSKPKMKTSTVGTMMNMGGFVDNFAIDDYHQTFGNVYMNRGGVVQGGDVQHMFLGGMVKKAGNILSKTPQARLLKFAVNQVKKLPVPPPAAKALNALKNLGKTNATAKPIPGNDGFDSGEQIPSFDVLAPGGLAKEHTLGIRR
tara:strand:- start:282 stop:1937 length:1656 start_codon:yes stop_codon:yes gene_type:complete